MKDGTAMLNPPVVASTNDFASINKHRPNGYAALLPALTRLIKRSIQKLIHNVLPCVVAVDPERTLLGFVS